MRRLKEGFYSIMKQANAVKAKPELKEELRKMCLEEKVEKPVTEAII